MHFLVFIPAIFIFFFCIYKLTKDDYIFIRKNISVEQIFDISFIVIVVSLLFARFIFFSNIFSDGRNYFFNVFSFRSANFSLPGAVIGGLVFLYCLGKYRKIPLGRLYDYFALAFLTALPAGFFCYIILLKKSEIFLFLMYTLFYVLLAIFFLKFLYPRFMNKTLKEGNISIFFLMFFSLLSFIPSVTNAEKTPFSFINVENFLLVVLFLFSFVLLFKQERGVLRKKATR